MNSDSEPHGEAPRPDSQGAEQPQKQLQEQLQEQLREQLRLAHEEVRRLQRDLDQAALEATTRAAQLREANAQLVVSSLRAQEEVEHTARALDEASRAARLDPLTELPNRVLMLDRLGHAIAVAKRHGGRLALLFVDLDNFKAINDAYGHTVGDAALRRTASLLVESVRGADTVGRQGGDEFLVLLSEVANLDDVLAVTDKMIANLGAAHQIGDVEIRLRSSVGISIFPDDGDDPTVLIECADSAMYRAKRSGASGRALFSEVASGNGTASLNAPDPSRQANSPAGRARSGHESRHRDLREANERLVLAALSAQEKEAKAVEALQRQTGFLARAAHELRSPLAPIREASAMMGMSRADSKLLYRAMGIIDGQVLRIERLVADLLDVSRAYTGRLRIERSRVELGAIVDAATANWRPVLASRGQQLDVRRPSSDLLLDGDPERLTQVLDNLLDNASRYTPDGGKIFLRVEEIDHMAVVTLMDSGVGIAPESLTTVYEPFEHGAAPPDVHVAQKNDVGLGIGLTVVRELVEAHDGTVRISSDGIGHGTQVIVALPLIGE